MVAGRKLGGYLQGICDKTVKILQIDLNHSRVSKCFAGFFKITSTCASSIEHFQLIMVFYEIYYHFYNFPNVFKMKSSKGQQFKLVSTDKR